MGLTNRQKRFVEEYLVDLNATQAAIRAGYSKKTARVIAAQNLSKLNIQEAVAAGQKNIAKRVQITQDDIIADLIEIKDRCMQRAPVVNQFGRQVKDEKGNNLWRFDALGANKSIDTMIKLLGFNKEDTRAGGNIIVTDEKSAIYKAVLDTVREHARGTQAGAEDEDTTPDDGDKNKEE